MADQDEDLQKLLDSALDGFTNFDVRAGSSQESKKKDSQDAASTSLAGQADNAGAKSTNMGKRQAVQGLGAGLGLPAKKSGKATGKKAVSQLKAPPSGSRNEASSSGSSKRPAASRSEASRTVEALHEQTRQTVEGMDPGGTEQLNDLMAQLQQMAGGEDMQSLMDNMMKQLLSKDVLYEPMKEIGQRYPVWLQKNAAKLSPDDRRRYERQFEYIRKLLHVYEHDPDNFEQVTALMQEMQECGHPPDEIIQELAPGVDFSEDGMPSLPDLLGASQGATGSDSKKECPIM